MTKREMFAEIRNIVADNAEMVAFIDHEIELLERKSNGVRKPTKTQVENEQFKDAILATLAWADRAMTIKELQENAKITLVSATSIVEGGAHDVILKDTASSNNNR